MLDKLREIVAEQLSVDEDEINMETSFRDDLGADSLDLYELAEMLKDEYDVEIPEEEVGNLLTVGDVIRFLEKHGIH